MVALEPPVIPSNGLYASHYCEENVYHLVDSLSRICATRDTWDTFVVFISNGSKTVCSVNLNLSGLIPYND